MGPRPVLVGCGKSPPTGIRSLDSPVSSTVDLIRIKNWFMDYAFFWDVVPFILSYG